MTAVGKWEILHVEVAKNKDGKQNVVLSVDWRYSMTQEVDGVKYDAHVTNKAILEPPTDSFTAFEDLSEEQVLSWVYADYTCPKEAIEIDVQQRLLAQVEPNVHQPELPWTKK